jgi:hypothetical protein
VRGPERPAGTVGGGRASAPNDPPARSIIGLLPAPASSPLPRVGVARLGLSWPLLVAVAAGLWVCGTPISVELLRDGDTCWHVAAGRWMFAHHAIPTADPFSHTMPGAPWTAHEWLSQVVLAAAHAAAGWTGLVLLTAAAFAATLSIVLRYVLGHQRPSLALLLTAATAVLLLPALLARPHVLTWPVMAAWVVVLLRAGERGRAPGWSSVLLVVLWANLHGSFPAALVLGSALALDGVLARPRAERPALARRWGGFLALTALASLATPHGLHGWTYVATVLRMDFMKRVISEWKSPNFQTFQPLELVLLQLLALALLGKARLPWPRVAMLLGLLHLALTHQRHVYVTGIVLPALLAAPLARRGAAGGGGAPPAPARPLPCALALVLAAAGAFASSRRAAPVPRTEPVLVAALAAARAAGADGPLLNSYGFGGWLVLHEVPVFVDGRADMYGDAFLERTFDAMRLEDRQGLLRLLDDYRIGWTILDAGTPAIAVLDGLAEWRRVHADARAVVHVRAPAAGGAANPRPATDGAR